MRGGHVDAGIACETLRQVVGLIRDGQVLISAHGYDEMAEDGILAAEAIEGSRRQP